jgi:uncharacterized membrane protein YheB (UPF0754 family)
MDLSLAILLLVVPPVTAFVGWITNWTVVRMIFWPESFRGVGIIGWQGIIYRHNRKFAEGLADLAAGGLLSARDITERIEPRELIGLYEDAFAAQARPIVQKCWDLAVPGLWESLPVFVQDPIIEQIRREGRRSMIEVFDELQDAADDLIDVRRLTVETLTRDGGRSVARLIRTGGSRELRFVELYGALFGALIGAVEALLWSVFQTWWLLPLVGGIVGLVTNWLAIQMIFRPQEPRRYLGFIRYQGLFPMRQDEIAADYAQVCADEIVTPRNLIGMLTEGKGGKHLVNLITGILREKYDDQVRILRGRPLSKILLEPTLDRIREAVVDEVMAAAPGARPELESYLATKLDVAETIRGRLQSLSKPEFERILRGIFEEDELTLVLLGGVLGAAIGLIQGVAMGML